MEEHDLDGYVSSVVKEPTRKVVRNDFKKNQSKAKRIIYDFVKDNFMSIIIPLNPAKECFNNLTNL